MATNNLFTSDPELTKTGIAVARHRSAALKMFKDNDEKGYKKYH